MNSLYPTALSLPALVNLCIVLLFKDCGELICVLILFIYFIFTQKDQHSILKFGFITEVEPDQFTRKPLGSFSTSKSIPIYYKTGHIYDRNITFLSIVPKNKFISLSVAYFLTIRRT